MIYRILIDGEVVANKVFVANNFILRLFGLLRKKQLKEGEGLLIIPCCQVHTFFMKYNIDVLFISKSGEIVHIEQNMEPFNVSPFIIKSNQVVELAAGAVENKGIEIGKKIAFDIVKEM